MLNDLIIQENIIIPHQEITFKVSRASGSGGQHVNKTNTRIQLLWNLHTTTALTAEQKERIQNYLKGRISKQGELQIACEQHRSQKRNQMTACEIFVQLIQQALYVPKERKATKMTRGQKERRLKHKKQRSDIKKQRSNKNWKNLD